jgi:L-threonylcarbamoyladenylate synthase
MTPTNQKIDAERPEILVASDPRSIERAVEALIDGELIVIPTDTVYGLAASYGQPDAIARVYQVKRRPPERPIALLVDRYEQVEWVATEVSAVALRFMEAFWPGGLTLVLPGRPDVPGIVTAGGSTVAVRMPDHPVPRSIARALGLPLPTTSANRSGQPSPTDAGQARTELNGDVALILNGGKTRGGVDSTVVDLTKTPPVVLRAGAVSMEDLRSVVADILSG